LKFIPGYYIIYVLKLQEKIGEEKMFYQSTRNNSEKATPSAAVLKGIAPDGGLYMLSDFSSLNFDWERTLSLSTLQMAEYILGTLFDDFSKEEMHDLVNAAYCGKFETEELTPTVKVGDKYVLELFRGPTSAFKDVALSMLPQLITGAMKKNGCKDEIVILTATSGDTGKAALHGFHDVEGTRIIVFYPHNGVSDIQKAQMVTQKGSNVHVCAVRGNFDDAQTGVKAIFDESDRNDILPEGIRLSSANSINIGRLAPQIVYYFKSYADLVAAEEIKKGDLVNFVVPTGNFGDILAGYFAKRLGLPVDTLVCASNANNVLTDFIKTGKYDKKREFFKTSSPSMDILVSSNLERLLYLLSDCDSELVASYMQDLKSLGEYTVNEKILERLQSEFWADCCSDEETSNTIKTVYEKYGYLADTHTAVGWNVAEKFIESTGNENKTVVLSTASPYKFATSVLSAIGEQPCDNEFEVMKQIETKTGIEIPKPLAELESLEVLHTDVIEVDEMFSYVLKKTEEK